MRMKYYLRGMGIGIMVTVLIFMIALIFYQPNLSDAEVIRRAEALGMVMSDEGTVADAAGLTADEGSGASEADDTSGSTTDDVVTFGDSADEDADTATESGSLGSDSTASGSTTSNIATSNSASSGSGSTSGSTSAGSTSESSGTSSDADDATTTRPVVTVETNDETAAAGSSSSSSSSSGSVSSETASVSIAGGDSSESVSRKLVQAGIVEDADEYNTYLVNHGYDRTLQNGTFSIPAGSSYEDIARIITKSN